MGLGGTASLGCVSSLARSRCLVVGRWRLLGRIERSMKVGLAPTAPTKTHGVLLTPSPDARLYYIQVLINFRDIIRRAASYLEGARGSFDAGLEYPALLDNLVERDYPLCGHN